MKSGVYDDLPDGTERILYISRPQLLLPKKSPFSMSFSYRQGYIFNHDVLQYTTTRAVTFYSMYSLNAPKPRLYFSQASISSLVQLALPPTMRPPCFLLTRQVMPTFSSQMKRQMA